MNEREDSADLAPANAGVAVSGSFGPEVDRDSRSRSLSQLPSLATRQAWLRWIPRTEPAHPPELYRWTGKLRVIVVTAFISLNLAVGIMAESLGLDVAFMWRLEIANMTLLATDLVLGLLIWRKDWDLPQLQRATLACLVLECSSGLLKLWAFGSVTSNQQVLLIIMVLIYRVAFGFRAGMVGLLFVLVGFLSMVGAEVLDWLPSQPILLAAPSVEYSSRGMLVQAAVNAIALVATFLVANWVLIRLQNKELAVMLLRESLAARDQGKVGHHSGSTFGDSYVVGNLIAAGGMGEVYRGRDRRAGRPVAIKTLHPHMGDRPDVLRRFQREAEIMARLKNEHIVEILDVGFDNGVSFMVMELLDGEDLRTRIRREGPMPLATVARIVDGVSDGLAAAHNAGVVHRDLKPANIHLRDRDDNIQVKILDFGISKFHGVATALTQELALLGTPQFMAPEQTMGLATEVDARTDVFALAAITYAAIAGTNPFVAGSVPTLLRRVRHEEPRTIDEMRADLPAGIGHVLTIGMAKDPEERYSTASEFNRDLQRALLGKTSAEVAARAGAVTPGVPSSMQPQGSEAPVVSPAGDTLTCPVE